ncbi:hypothetical protein MRX96_011260 [Rhipicephalus microplus]
MNRAALSRPRTLHRTDGSVRLWKKSSLAAAAAGRAASLQLFRRGGKPPNGKRKEGEEAIWRRFTKQGENGRSLRETDEEKESERIKDEGVEEGDDGNIAAAAERKWKRAPTCGEE